MTPLEGKKKSVLKNSYSAAYVYYFKNVKEKWGVSSW